MLAQIQEAVDFIRARITSDPDYGIILGTGLGALVKDIDIDETIEYQSIPHFPISTVEFHKGKLILGSIAGKKVVVMQGRFHFYEGYTMKEVTFPVRVLKMLGIQKLFISNAAGGLNPQYQLSDLMIINDHINLMPENPLVGKNLNELGDRFPDMSEPYDLELVKEGLSIASKHKFRIHEGVYAAVTGPNLETPAEYRYLRTIGADAVGMSTIPENIVARHMGIPCFAISVITDLCYPGALKKVVVEEIIAAAMAAEPHMTTIIKELIAKQE